MRVIKSTLSLYPESFVPKIRESATMCLTMSDKLVSGPEGIPEKGTRATLMGEP